MGVHSGKWGVVNGQKGVSAWTVNDTSDMKEYVNSQTKGGKGRLPGPNSWTGSFEQHGGKPVAGVMPGTVFAFEGYEAPDNDTVGGTGTIFSGNAMVERIVVTWNWGTGDILKTSVEFLGHLALTQTPAQAAIFDATTPDFFGSKQIATPKIQVNNAGGLIDWPNLTTLTLTISSEVQPYLNSSTAGWTGRKAGNWDVDIAATEQEVLRSLFDKDDILELQMFVDDAASEYWHIKWGRVKEFTNVRVDRETAMIISRNVSIPWSVYDDEDPRVIGQIRLPGEASDWWPVSGS